MHRALTELIEINLGLVSRREDIQLKDQIDYALRKGELVRILPSVYAHRDLADDWYTRVRAVGLWQPDAVIDGPAAGALTFWPDTEPSVIGVAGTRATCQIPGFSFSARVIPPDLITTRDRVRITHPNLTVLDLIDTHGGDAIDDALRLRMTTVQGMRDALALTRYRRGNGQRHQLVLDSRANPWSSGERRAHVELRAAGIHQWVANKEVWIDGQQFFLDIAFEDCPLVAEIDGKVHMRRDRFDSDRRRGNLLLLAGWDVLRFTSSMLDDGLLIPTVRRARARYGLS